MIELTENDLLAIISKDELDGLAKELIEDGQPEPIPTAIAEGIGTIRMYADPKVIPNDALKRIWRILAVCWIYNRLGNLPEKREKEQDWAIGALKDIRDGKFKYMAVDESRIPAGGKGAWGGNSKIKPR